MPADRQDLRFRLAAVAATQSGLFTAAQALEVGYSYQAQKYHADRGNWLRLERGIYRLPEWPRGEREDLVRWTLWSRGRAVVSHETALAVHELGDVNPGRVHLTVPPGFRAQVPGAVLHRAEIPEGDLLDCEGFRVTTPLRTFLDLAAGDLELGQLAVALREALEGGLLSETDLRFRAEEEYGAHAVLRIERALRLGEAE
jgi:hypothetical protein